MVSVDAGTGQCGNSRQVHVSVVTGQAGIVQCGNSRDRYTSVW